MAAVLSRRLETWDRVWRAEAGSTDDPRGKVLAIFDAVTVFRAEVEPTQWCSFLATASERPEADDEPADLVSRDSALLRERLRGYAEAADPGRADLVVETVDARLQRGALQPAARCPRDPAPLARRTVAAALGWEDV